MSVGAWEHLCVDTFCIFTNSNSQTSNALLLLSVLHIVSLDSSVPRELTGLPFPVQHASWLPRSSLRTASSSVFILIIAFLTDMPAAFITTYTYEDRTPRHIACMSLQLTALYTMILVPGPEYRIVHFTLPVLSPAPAFDAVLCTWGDHAKVSILQTRDTLGHNALNANLGKVLSASSLPQGGCGSTNSTSIRQMIPRSQCKWILCPRSTARREV